ncbi:unnamed protein product [Cuscuta europaea]|uniref:Uncharacterized protein n=1 Tax=Cuscuta europaea TaxID=41803 RepID=A0A9P0ZU75_CUSEU|nr:unnamed protein product [Cuscuta europaea]
MRQITNNNFFFVQLRPPADDDNPHISEANGWRWRRRNYRWSVVTLEQGSSEDGGGGGVKRQLRPAASDDGEDWRCPATAEIVGVRRWQRPASGGGVKWRRRTVVKGGG